jgi:hypothetical protein
MTEEMRDAETTEDVGEANEEVAVQPILKGARMRTLAALGEGEWPI